MQSQPENISKDEFKMIGKDIAKYIVSYIDKPKALFKLSMVSKFFHEITKDQLYQRLYRINTNRLQFNSILSSSKGWASTIDEKASTLEEALTTTSNYAHAPFDTYFTQIKNEHGEEILNYDFSTRMVSINSQYLTMSNKDIFSEIFLHLKKFLTEKTRNFPKESIKILNLNTNLKEVTAYKSSKKIEPSSLIFKSITEACIQFDYYKFILRHSSLKKLHLFVSNFLIKRDDTNITPLVKAYYTNAIERMNPYILCNDSFNVIKIACNFFQLFEKLINEFAKNKSSVFSYSLPQEVANLKKIGEELADAHKLITDNQKETSIAPVRYNT